MKVATWNVLAQPYCHPERYEGCPAGWDDPQLRSTRIAEIVADLCRDNDVVCLQEVDAVMTARLRAGLDEVTMCYAAHPHRQDGVAILTRHQPVSSSILHAGRMKAVAFDLDCEGVRVRAVYTHLEWSDDGMKGAEQLEHLAAGLDSHAADIVVVAMDANGSWHSPVCAPLRTRGWIAADAAATAMVNYQRWRSLDVIAVNAGVVETACVAGRAPVIPSLAWPSDHCVVTAAVSGPAGSFLSVQHRASI